MGDQRKKRPMQRWRGEVVVKSEPIFRGLLGSNSTYSWIVLLSQEGGDVLDRVKPRMQKMKLDWCTITDLKGLVEYPSISPPFLLSVALTKMGQHPAFSGSTASSTAQAPTAATTYGQCAATDRVPSQGVELFRSFWSENGGWMGCCIVCCSPSIILLLYWHLTHMVSCNGWTWT